MSTAAEDYTQDCPKCGTTIASPVFLVQEKPVYDPRLEAYRTRIHISPNDVEYHTHVTGCDWPDIPRSAYGTR